MSDTTRLDGTITRLDRATTLLERPLRSRRFADLNPLPHAGTISTFLLVVVIVSGLYLTLFFSFGHAASYDSVAAMEDHPIQRTVRALHRYGSAMLVLTTLVHGWRVFVGQRFTGRARRWRWASGVTALGLVWLAGVTGYWLVWDRRAAAISEIAAQLVRVFPGGEAIAVRHLIGVSPGSGATLLFSIWVVHLGLSAVLAWVTYRHLRRTAFRSFPPLHWMAALGGCLGVASVALPVGMLGPARPDQLVADMAIDPFVLFLLPPLLTDARWLAVVVALLAFATALVVPRLLRRADAPAAVVDADRCTGCELCVLDCPYEAIELRGDDAAVAVVDPRACVSCGICIGSCAFDAIVIGDRSEPLPDMTDALVAVVCDRQLSRLTPEADVTIPVRCVGMFATHGVREFHERGAASVLLVGCPPGECRYGVGGQLAIERLRGDRSPHPPRAFADIVRPTYSPEVTDTPESNRLALAVAMVAVSVLAVVAATQAPFRRPDDRAGLRVAVDHEAGHALAETGATLDRLSALDVFADGTPLGTLEPSTGDTHSVGFADWSLDPGTRAVEVRAEGVTLFAETIEVTAGQRVLVSFTDAPIADDAAAGRDVFTSRAAGCDVCHSTTAGRDGIGPSLYGVASEAGSRVAGLDAENYLRQSILLPDQYVVEGWPAGQMLPIYRERLTDAELESLIAYLLTLEVDR